MQRLSFYSASLTACLMLAGCFGEPHADLRDWVGEQRNTARPVIRPLAEPLAFHPQAYVATDGADPFGRLKLTQVLSRESAHNTSNMALLHAEQNRRKEDLESFPLDAMSMVGSLQQQGAKTALLRVNQLIYQVKVGNYLGQNYGKIIDIDEHNIKLREIVQDASGDWVERVSTLDLQEGP